MNKVFWIVIILTFMNYKAFSMDVEIIHKYFSFKFANYINVYHCFNPKDEIIFHRNLSSHFSLRFFRIDENLIIHKSDVIRYDNKKLAFLVDASNCPYDDILSQFSNLQVYSFTRPFLIFMNDSSQIEPTFYDKIMTISTDLKIVIDNYYIYDVYNPSTLHGALLNYTHYSQWNPVTRTFSRKYRQHLYWTRRNMTGIVFKSMVVLPDEFAGNLEDYLVNEDHREINILHRFHYVLMTHARDYYNYEMIMSRGRSLGYKDENGTFDGLVRALEIRQVDFGSSPLFVKAERIPAVDYGRRTWTLKACFLFRRPKRPASFAVFLRPLDYQVWYLTAAAGVVIIILLKISLNTEIVNLQDCNEEGFESTWSHISLFTFAAFCQQGSATSPSGISSRICFFFVFIFMVLLFQYYSASIVSILLMTPARFINTIPDLAYSSLTVRSEDIGYHVDYFRKMENDTIIHQLYTKSPRAKNGSFFLSAEEGLANVAKGGYAFHVDLAKAYPIIAKTFDEDAICSLDDIQLYHIQQMHQNFQKGTGFREMIDHVLHKMDEFGVMHRQIKFWHARKPECIRLQAPTSAVSLEEFYPALSMLLLGILFSILILIGEQLHHMYKTKKMEELMKKRLRAITSRRKNTH